MKKLLTVVAVMALASLSVAAPAQSADRPTSVPGCAKSTAKGDRKSVV